MVTADPVLTCQLGVVFTPGQSGVRYDLYNLTAGKHAVEVIAYCSANGERISSQQKRFTCEYSLSHA